MRGFQFESYYFDVDGQLTDEYEQLGRMGRWFLRGFEEVKHRLEETRADGQSWSMMGLNLQRYRK